MVLFLAIWLSGFAASAQGMSGIARVDADPSRFETSWLGDTRFDLHLSQGVPFRVFTLDDPRRLILDFREVEWSGVRAQDLLPEPGLVSALRFGRFQPGWTRMVADLTQPVLPDDVALRIDKVTNRAILSLNLVAVEPDMFAERSGAPDAARWPVNRVNPPVAPIDDARFVVVIDPGHGGVDPGAEREGATEKELMLTLAQALREALLRRGDVEVILTREGDDFVSLEGRVALAHQSGADIFVSLHADALSQGGAQGATVYTLSKEASDAATAQLAARHNRADIIAGADLTGSDDGIASVLLDLARQETSPRSASLAKFLATRMTEAGGPMNRRALRNAGFSVLKSADIPSVLVEVGFLSSKRDLDNLRDPLWRARIIKAMAEGILAWRDADAAQRGLVRQ